MTGQQFKDIALGHHANPESIKWHWDGTKFTYFSLNHGDNQIICNLESDNNTWEFVIVQSKGTEAYTHFIKTNQLINYITGCLEVWDRPQLSKSKEERTTKKLRCHATSSDGIEVKMSTVNVEVGYDKSYYFEIIITSNHLPEDNKERSILFTCGDDALKAFKAIKDGFGLVTVNKMYDN